MKPYHSVILFLTIVAFAIAASVNSYSCAKESIVADMNQALAKTLAKKSDRWITPDTIADYRSHLKIASLRHTSVIYYAMDDKGTSLKSRKMTWGKANGTRLEFQGFANCSMASILALSDQRLPLSLYGIALLWGLLSTIHFRRSRLSRNITFGGIVYDEAAGSFLSLTNEEITLTPMQEQLLTMFFKADSHRLGKKQICEALWPKKPDASDTLYTLIRRIKPILADKGLTIKTGRGKDYKLEKT